MAEKADLSGIHGNGVEKVDVKISNVAELIAALQKCPPDAPVDIEGCDCIGEAGDVTFDGYNQVLIGRK